MSITYRPCVGICLFNDAGNVFVGERLDNLGAWQMPQGGIDDDADIMVAAFREMKEEIGTDKATLIRIHDQKIKYDIPPEVLINLAWKHKYQGQIQTWVAMKFTGTDADIKLDADKHPEFGRYQWVPLPETINLIVPFKRGVYAQVIDAFKDIA